MLNPVFKVGNAADGDQRHRKLLLPLLRRVQLPESEAVLERYPHQFSGGQRQRLVIAAACAHVARACHEAQPAPAQGRDHAIACPRGREVAALVDHSAKIVHNAHLPAMTTGTAD